ncbi:hypothetical protein FKM82_016399 [Ascaphus truei]
MSDRRGHLHFKLNYAEEITIKKELERLHKHPQQDFRHAAVESHLGSGLCLPLMQEQPNPYSDQFNSIPSPISGAYRMLFQPTCQSSPEAVVFQKVKSSDQKSRKKQPDLKLRPLAKSARSSSREIIRGSADPKDHLFMQPKAIGSNNKDEKKPAIAALVGTTKSIAVFSRPEPPSKPRSYMPKVSPRPRISLKPLAAQQKERKGPKVVRNAPPKSKKAANVRLLQTPILDSDTSSSSSDSDSEDSSDSGSIKMKIKQKKLGIKRENPLVTHEKERIARRKSVGLGSHPFKTPTTQQFSDVPDTAMTFPQGGQEKSPYESTQGKLSYVLTPPVKTTARSVDEIIASLRSPQIYAASDLMIKQLMESVLGENYIITFGILDIAAAQTDDNVVEGVSVPLVGKEDQEEPVLDVSSSTEEIPKTFSQEEITTKEEARSLLKLPTQIAFSDIIHVKGDAAPLARRDTGKIRPPAALLATWEPRSKERGLQTIHHFCTVSPSHVLPSYLQLASRVHHTVDRKGHSIPIEKGVLPKRAEEEHSTNAYSVSNSQAVLKEEIRILQEGLPVSAFQIHDQRDSVITLPPHSARSLEEWQRIAEYYVEGPRIELVGEQISKATLAISYCLSGSSPVQQALVQSFCQKYNSAFECLLSAIKVKTTPLMMVVLGKIQMKAKKNKDAAESFRRALAILSSSDHHLPSTPDEAEIFYLLGLCYMEQFHFSQAFEALTSAVKARSDFSDAYFQRGLCCMRLQQAKCVYDFNKALEINPKHFQAFLCRAAFYGHRKRYSKAIMNCNAAIEVQPHSVRAYLYRGALKYYIKAYKFAIQDLTKAAELDPSCSLVYYNRGVCYQQTKMYDKAVTDYSTVLVLGGWKEVEIKVLVNRGLVYLELHDYANALEDFQAVALRTPRDINIHQVIGNCYHRTHQYEEAVKAFKQVLQINPLSPEGYIGRGTAYMEYGHKNGTKQAQRDFVSALHLSPKCIAARICLGYNLQAQGFFQQAWNQFTMALDIDAHCMLGFEGRAIVSLQMGDTFSALQDMNAALKLGVTAQLLTNRGVIHQFMGKLHNAMRDYQAAVTADPQYPLAYFNAANLYLHNRQFSQARPYYSRALELDPTNESAALNRGITNMLLQDVQGALQDFQMAIHLCPVSAAAFFNRASLHSTLQQYQQAESDISQALVLQPEDPLIFKLRADIRGKLGLYKEAIEDYERAITLLQQSEYAQ